MPEGSSWPNLTSVIAVRRGTSNIWIAGHQYPVVWETVFVVGKGHPVTANSLIDSFDIQYSESQVKREAEADTHTFFCDFIHSVGMNGKLNF